MSMHDDDLDTQRAKQRAYELLGGLVLDGLDATRLAEVRALPGIGEVVPPVVDLEALAAEHQALFGYEVFPFAGVFLGASGLVGEGTPAVVLRAAHSALGVPCPSDPSPDHLGHALRLLAMLVDAELEARAHHDDADARTLVQQQRRVLDQALLPWMPPLWAALAGQPASVLTRAMELCVGVLARHRGELGEPTLALLSHEPALPSVDGVLDDPRAGLAIVAQALVTTARSGVYLARRDLETLARRSGLPRGMGSRAAVLERLLRTAVELGALPRLLDELGRLLVARDDAYAALAAEPELGPHVHAWRRRLVGSLRLVARLREAAPRVEEDEGAIVGLGA
jgi:TorA maturation chaperone TorD